MLSLPGTPILRYGDEIGMGDDLSLKERMSVRTPMQWSSAPNGGFTTADSCVLPVIADPTYGYKTVQVAQQLHDTASFLHWTRKMLLLRKKFPEICMTTCQVLPSGSPHVLIMHYTLNDSETFVIHNFSSHEQKISLSAREAGTWNQQAGMQSKLTVKKGKNNITIPGFGYSWYKTK